MNASRTAPIYCIPISCAQNSTERDVIKKVLDQVHAFIIGKKRPFSYERFRTAIEEEMRQAALTEIEHHLHISEDLLACLLNQNRHLQNEINRKAQRRLRRRDRQQLRKDREVQALYGDTVLQLLGWRSMVLEAQSAGIERVTDHFVRIP